jgi:hypothetical protein
VNKNDHLRRCERQRGVNSIGQYRAFSRAR